MEINVESPELTLLRSKIHTLTLRVRKLKKAPQPHARAVVQPELVKKAFTSSTKCD